MSSEKISSGFLHGFGWAFGFVTALAVMMAGMAALGIWSLNAYLHQAQQDQAEAAKKASEVERLQNLPAASPPVRPHVSITVNPRREPERQATVDPDPLGSDIAPGEQVWPPRGKPAPKVDVVEKPKPKPVDPEVAAKAKLHLARMVKDDDDRKRWLSDVVKLYPGTEAAKAAQGDLDRIK